MIVFRTLLGAIWEAIAHPFAPKTAQPAQFLRDQIVSAPFLTLNYDFWMFLEPKIAPESTKNQSPSNQKSILDVSKISSLFFPLFFLSFLRTIRPSNVQNHEKTKKT